MILAIDPGSAESAYVVIDENLKPIMFGKIENEELLTMICHGDFNICDKIAIEMIASYGMAVGKEVFETCVFIGKIIGYFECNLITDITHIYRKDEKMNLCHSMKANDSNITQALIDRFAPGVRNKGKGTKKEPRWFYGFKKDIWQAYAVGITYYDMYLKK